VAVNPDHVAAALAPLVDHNSFDQKLLNSSSVANTGRDSNSKPSAQRNRRAIPSGAGLLFVFQALIVMTVPRRICHRTHADHIHVLWRHVPKYWYIGLSEVLVKGRGECRQKETSASGSSNVFFRGSV